LFPSPNRAPEGDLILVDGGVVNNLGTQWWEPAAGGASNSCGARTVTIIVDASVALPRWNLTGGHLSGTLAAAFRVFNLIYFNSVRPRLDSHRRQYPSGVNAAIGVSLAEDPFQVLCANGVTDLNGRTSDLGRRFASRRREMTETAVRVQDVPTSLRALGCSAVRDLVSHGYYLATIELAGAALGNGGTVVLEDWFQSMHEKRS
jgi:hypothetical protein